MPVTDWFIDYITTVIRTTRSGLLPDDPGDPFWAPLEQAFIRAGIAHGAAVRALEGLEAPPESPAPFRAALIAAARTCQIQDANAAAVDGAEMDRDTAFAHSRDCPECSGSGLTSREVYSRRHDRRMHAGCICHLCPMGRWTAKRHEKQDGSRLIDLADHPGLQWPGEVEAPEFEGLSIRAVWDSVRASGPMVRRVADAGAAPRPPRMPATGSPGGRTGEIPTPTLETRHGHPEAAADRGEIRHVDLEPAPF